MLPKKLIQLGLSTLATATIAGASLAAAPVVADASGASYDSHQQSTVTLGDEQSSSLNLTIKTTVTNGSEGAGTSTATQPTAAVGPTTADPSPAPKTGDLATLQSSNSQAANTPGSSQASVASNPVRAVPIGLNHYFGLEGYSSSYALDATDSTSSFGRALPLLATTNQPVVPTNQKHLSLGVLLMQLKGWFSTVFIPLPTVVPALTAAIGLPITALLLAIILILVGQSAPLPSSSHLERLRRSGFAHAARSDVLHASFFATPTPVWASPVAFAT